MYQTITEHSPLFDAGFHEIELADLEKIFVNPFHDETRRQELTAKLRLFLEKLKEIGAHFEVWLDGSFSTNKEKPGDVDIAVIFDPEEINKLEQHQIEFLDTKHEIIKIRYNLDVYYVPNDMHKKSYWRGLFGFARDEQPKGIPRLYIGGSHE